MEIICDGCDSKLNVPDEKIPQGQKVTITCPKCKQKLTLDSSAPKPVDTEPVADESKTGPVQAIGGDAAALEFYEEGIRLALVAESDPGQLEKLKETIEDIGLKYITAENTGQAISKMRFHTFNLVVISDQFDGIELAQSPILQYLNHLSMSIRRKMFIALVGDSFNTMDHMMAFTMSANLVVNRRDLDKFTGILKNAISDNEKFYKVFMDTLTELGKN